MHVSLISVRAFDAVVRTSSFRKAADELNVTPAAVSHQIKQLEQQLGRKLFVRTTRKVALTEEGRSLSAEICPALQNIRVAIENRIGKTQFKRISLGISSLLASRWLVPRLGKLWERHPEIDLALHHTNQPVWQQVESYDLCVDWGTGNWKGLEATMIFRVEASPVVSPFLMAESKLGNQIDRLREITLLHHRNSAGWRDWFKAHDIEYSKDQRGLIFEDANVELQAALAGEGISLGIFPLIDTEIESGKLLKPYPTEYRPKEAYYLIEAEPDNKSEHVKQVKNWLLAEARN